MVRTDNCELDGADVLLDKLLDLAFMSEKLGLQYKFRPELQNISKNIALKSYYSINIYIDIYICSCYINKNFNASTR